MITRLSALFLRTLREDPADAEVPSHRLLVRAGFTPHNIKCYRQLVGVNTLAVCRVD